MRSNAALDCCSTLCSLATSALLLASCAGDGGGTEYYGTTARAGKSDTTFYVNNLSEPEYLDPGMSTESAGTSLINDLFEGLAVLHPKTLEPQQAIATHWEQTADNRLFRFHLRKDAKWSDGKPVTAGDFIYAWRRVLTASTGARMATIMYPIKNGKLYHQGNLKVLSKDVALKALGGAEGATATLPKGTAVRILKPARVTSLRTPLDAQPANANIAYDPKTAELSSQGEPLGGGARSEPISYRIVALGDATRCNESDDHYYRVTAEGVAGWLPGCALDADKSATEALIERFTELPTFAPQPAAKPDTDRVPPQPVLRGFVANDAMVADPQVIGARAVGDHVIEVECEEPTPYFLELVAYITYFPVRQDLIERFEKEGRPDLWYRPENIITNGPYVLDEHKFRYEISFKRNPHYYDHDQLRLHRIVWFSIADYSASLALYKTGELDYTGQNVSLPSVQMDRLATYKDFDRSNWLATYWYEFNVDKPPVDKVEVRHALNLAVDKQQLIDKITRSGQQPATHYVPDFTGSGYSDAILAAQQAGKPRFSGKGFDHDPAHARELMRKAGYTIEERDGGYFAPDFPPLEILYNTSEGHQKIAVALQDMWKRHLGISVALRNEEWKVMLKNLRDGHFQIARFGWVADYNHPHTYLDLFLSFSSNNWTHWADPKYDALVERAAATADPLASIGLYLDAEAMAVEAMPRLPLYFYTKSSMVKPYVKGYYPNGANRHLLRWMWIDPNWRTHSDNVPAIAPRPFPKPGIIAP